jgi:hypothetical protein
MLSSFISIFELISENRDLSSDEYDIFLFAKNKLNNIYHDEAIY